MMMPTNGWVIVCTSTIGLLCSMVAPSASQMKYARSDTLSLEKGYYLIQEVNSYNKSAFGAIATPAEAESIAIVLTQHRVSGVEFGSLYFHDNDVAACKSVAGTLRSRGIDLWLTSAGLQGRIHAFNNDVFPTAYRACAMTTDGTIVPATVWSLGAPQKVPAFDVMNPDAMTWFLDRYKEMYLEPMKQYTSGYFFNEDCLYYGIDPGYSNNMRINYYDLPVYSDAVLAQWQQYCKDRSIMDHDTLVSRFPVHTEAMVANGGGKTAHYAGYQVPVSVEAGTSIVSIPRNTGVWAAWDDFLTSLYASSFIEGIAKAVHAVHNGDPGFKGVIYFGLHTWSLGYEEVTDPEFRIDSIMTWVPWGTQRGVRLSKICALPHVDHVVCETYPPLRAHLGAFAREYQRIVKAAGKSYGVQLHRDDDWRLGEKDSEADRWALIQELQPNVVARYPIGRLFPADALYSQHKEESFDSSMAAYRPQKPPVPILSSPLHGAVGVVVNPTLNWNPSERATHYHVQVSSDSIFSALLIDDSSVTSIFLQVGPLSGSTTYYWRASAMNIGGASAYSSTRRFATTDAVSVKGEATASPASFALEQNSPNPFNPTTVIRGQWPVTSEVRLVVYDVLGRKVAVLAEGKRPAGAYAFAFDGANL